MTSERKFRVQQLETQLCGALHHVRCIIEESNDEDSLAIINQRLAVAVELAADLRLHVKDEMKPRHKAASV